MRPNPRPIGSFLTLLLLLLPLGHAQDDPPADGGRLLNCLVDDLLPDEPGLARQGGYAFEYQSLRGATEDARSCTVYRLRNSPDGPPTPFRWTQGDAVVVDKVRLARCEGAAGACPWASFAKYFPGEIDTNLSVLSYGLNADAYHEQASTYMNTLALRDSDVAEARDVEASSVGTEVEGTFATADDESLPLHLIVKSRFEPAPSGRTLLVYEIDDLGGRGTLLSDDVRIVWDALEEIPAVAAALAASGGDDASDDGPRATRTADALEVVVPADAFELNDTFMLRIYARGEAEPMIVVDMPAYVPLPAH